MSRAQPPRASWCRLSALASGCTKRQSGQSLVELALILPAFFLILLGILDFGRVFYDYERITNSAREGAMWLANHPSATTAQVASRVRTEGGACAADSAGNPTTVVVTSKTVASGEATVAVECRFSLITPFMATALGLTDQHMMLRSQARMPVLGGS